jgi:hypothetical protein
MKSWQFARSVPVTVDQRAMKVSVSSGAAIERS